MSRNFREKVRRGCNLSDPKGRCILRKHQCDKKVCCLYCRSFWACFSHRVCKHIQKQDKLMKMVLYNEWRRWIIKELEKDVTKSRRLKKELEKELK